MKQKKPIVLVVDDEAAILEAFQMILEDGFDVLSAENGLEAMALIEKGPRARFPGYAHPRNQWDRHPQGD